MSRGKDTSMERTQNGFILKFATRRGHRRQQLEGLAVVAKQIKGITETKNKEDVYGCAGIATGYANAMREYGLISAEELKDVIELIGEIGEDALGRIEREKRPVFLRAIKRGLRA